VHSTVQAIRHEDRVRPVDRDSARIADLSSARPLPQGLTVGGELLDPAVEVVGDVDVARRVRRHIDREVELSGAASV
jgi:hypothetical protein